ncbi:MAG: sigma factor [Bacteroidales bacterium]
MDESELIRNLRKGDEAAFDYLFRKYFRKLCLYAEHFLRNRETAREIVMDFFVDLWDNSRNITIASNLNGYLFRSIHNRCIKYLKQEDKRKQIIESNLYYLLDNELIGPFSESFSDIDLISAEIENGICESINIL